VGVALTPELLRSRYVKPDAELIAPDNILPHVARTSGGRDKPIEFLGEVKIRSRQQLEDVENISLRMLGIARPCSSAEQEKEMEEFSHLKSLDLAGNLLSNWDDVLGILKQFNNLQSVSLASNRINDICSSSLLSGFSMTGMVNLNLNSTNINSFKTLQLIGEAMPNLEDLCVAHCDLSDIDECHNNKAPEVVFQNLILLDLSDCNLTSWEQQIMSLQSLPKLESLILNDNKIEHINIPAAESDTTFASLTSLQLAGTSISDWSAIDNLSGLPALRSLRLRNTPLTSQLGVGEVRSTVIARLPNLEFFNASPITERERVEAERRYVSNVARELLMISSGALLSSTVATEDEKKTAGSEDEETKAKQAQVHVCHPRFQSLFEKHKETMMSSCSANGSSGQGNIGEDVIGVTIRSMAAASCDVEPLRKRIPRSLKVGRIKAMCARAFGLDIDLQILHFRIENDPFPTEMNDDDHTLAYYGVIDGAEILVNEVDVEAQEREKIRQSEEHNKLVQEQEQHVAVIQSMQKNEQRMVIGS
jgi:tubulin-specific chaperone E